MNWLLLSAAALGIAVVALRRNSSRLKGILQPEASPALQPLLRRPTALDQMIDDLRRERDPLGRHRLLEAIVEESHRRRSDPATNKLFLRFARMHVSELPKMAEPLKAANGGRLPAVASFQLLASALEADGHPEDAVTIREQAAAWGLKDGAKAEPIRKIKKEGSTSKRTRPTKKRPVGTRAVGRSKRRP
jgi:hypothetical protein